MVPQLLLASPPFRPPHSRRLFASPACLLSRLAHKLPEDGVTSAHVPRFILSSQQDAWHALGTGRNVCKQSYPILCLRKPIGPLFSEALGNFRLVLSRVHYGLHRVPVCRPVHGARFALGHLCLHFSPMTSSKSTRAKSEVGRRGT